MVEMCTVQQVINKARLCVLEVVQTSKSVYTPCRNFTNFLQKQAYQSFLSEILTWESMKFFLYILNGAGKSVIFTTIFLINNKI